MFLIQAPYPLYKTTCVLPSPQVGNTQALAATVKTQRTVGGLLHTYISPKRGRRALQWDFLGSREKAREVKEFCRRYGGVVIRVTDHNGTVFLGNITFNPFEIAGAGRAGGWPGGEAGTFSLRLEEKV